jgi:hypothetical protein
VIGGGANNTVSASAPHAGILAGQYNFIGQSASLAFIGGGADNWIGSNAVAAAVAGGQVNTIGEDSGGAFIGGGLYHQNLSAASFIGGGLSNVIDTLAYAAAIGGGENHYVGAVYDGTIGGGYLNYLDDGADYATVAGGADNWVQTSAQYATIPGGAQATAISYGQLAYAGGMFVEWGDAQASLYVSRTTTTNATQRELFLDGVSERMRVPTGASWMFQIMIIARNTSGNSACYRAEGSLKNVGGTVSLVGTPTVTTVASDIAGISAPAVLADNTNKALVIRATGIAAQRIRWVARVQTVELKF